MTPQQIRFGLKIYVTKEGVGWAIHAAQRSPLTELDDPTGSVPEKLEKIFKPTVAAALALIAARVRVVVCHEDLPLETFSGPDDVPIKAPLILRTKFTRTWPSTLRDRKNEDGVDFLLRDFGPDHYKILLATTGKKRGKHSEAGRHPGTIKLGINLSVLDPKNIRIYEIVGNEAKPRNDSGFLQNLINGIQAEYIRANPSKPWRSLLFDPATAETQLAVEDELLSIASPATQPTKPDPYKPLPLRGGGSVAYQHPPPTKLQEQYLNEIKQQLEHLHAETRAQAERAARQNILNVMGELTERFGASSSYLFVRDWSIGNSDENLWIEPGSPLSLYKHHNTGITTGELDCELPASARQQGEGIVGHVAVTRRPYLAHDVKNDGDKATVLLYKNSVKSTRSELAVPLVHMDLDGKEHVVAVFNLESDRRNKFLEAYQGELMAAATKLTPDILVIHHLKTHPASFGWHPLTAGWTPDLLLDCFCAAVAERPPKAANSQGLPRPSCTIWYAEPSSAAESEGLYVRSTARYDYEYLSRRSLPKENSFTGLALQHPEHAVLFGPTEEIRSFSRRDKSDQMGMVYAFATPFFTPDLSHSNKPTGAVNLYFFREELPEEARKNVHMLEETVQAHFPRQLMVYLASQIANLITNCQKLRMECASAYLRYSLHDRALPGLTDFDTAKDVFLKCLDANYCSIFARESKSSTPETDASQQDAPPNAVLHCVATTGLRTENAAAVDPAQAFYDLDDPTQYGLSSRLAEKCGQIIRQRTSVARLTGRREVPPSSNRYLETVMHSDTEHRPFLGVSADCRALPRPVGIIRILRKSGSKPFVLTDGILLLRLGREIHHLFLNWQASRRTNPSNCPLLCGARFPFSIRVFGQAPTLMKLEAIDRLGREFPPGAVWNHLQLQSVLVDLLEIHRKDLRETRLRGGLLANFRLCRPPSADTPYKILATHRIQAPDPPSPEDIARHEEPGKSIGHLAIINKVPITFSAKDSPLFRKLVPESEQVISGVCMPTRFMARTGEVWGVLSLDRDDMRLGEWRSEHLEVLALAARQLEFVGRDNCLEDKAIYDCDNWSQALLRFLTQSLPAAGCPVANVYKHQERTLPRDKIAAAAKDPPATVSRALPFNIDLQATDRTTLKAATDDLDKASDLVYNDRGGFRLRLRYSGFDTRLTLKGVVDEQFRSVIMMQTKITEICQLWSRFANSRIAVGTKPLFWLWFEEDHTRQPQPAYKGLTFWRPRLALGPDLFGEQHRT